MQRALLFDSAIQCVLPAMVHIFASTTLDHSREEAFSFAVRCRFNSSSHFSSLTDSFVEHEPDQPRRRDTTRPSLLRRESDVRSRSCKSCGSSSRTKTARARNLCSQHPPAKIGRKMTRACGRANIVVPPLGGFLNVH